MQSSRGLLLQAVSARKYLDEHKLLTWAHKRCAELNMGLPAAHNQGQL